MKISNKNRLPLCDIFLCPGSDLNMSNFISKVINLPKAKEELSVPVYSTRTRQQKRKIIEEDEAKNVDNLEIDENELDLSSDSKENKNENEDDLNFNQKRNVSDYEKMIQRNRQERMAFLKSLKIDEVKEEFKDISTNLITKRSSTSKKPIKTFKESIIAKEVTPIRKSRRLSKIDINLSEEAVYAKAVKEATEHIEHQRKVIPSRYSFKEAAEVKEAYTDFVNLFEFKSEEHDEKFNADYVSYFKQMELQESNIAKVVPTRISCLAIHPSTRNIFVLAGSKRGHLGFWNVTSDSNPVVFSPHNEFISNLKINPHNHYQIITSSYDGTLRCGDVEEKVFNEIYNVSDETSCTYFDFLSQTTLLVSQKNGNVSLIDVRNGSLKSEKKHECHDRSVKTVSVHPVNKNIFLTADNKGLLKLWDLRKLQKKPIISVPHHTRSVSSAFFSPVTGNSILTTSHDDYLCIFDSTNVEKEILCKKSIKHNNWTGRWLTPFKATWLPNSEDAFVVGSMSTPRRIEIFNGKGTDIFNFQDENLNSVTSVNQFHPSLNVLAGGNSSGKVFVFIDRDLKF